MKKSILLWTKATYVATFILLLLCLTFSCQQQVEEEITEEEAKTLTEEVLEIFNEGNLALADKLLAPDFVEHLNYSGEDVVGVDAYKEHVTNVRTTIPDIHFTTEELFVKDDKIVWRWIYTGTNTGTTSDIPPTGKKARIEGVGILRVVDGKIVERLPYWNQATMLRQLGYTFTPPQEPSEQ